MESITLIRHGQSTFNAAYETTGRDPGHFDARLTALGRRQAEQACVELAATEFDLVVCTPLTRAIETSHVIFGHRGIPVYVTCRHRERLESSCDVGRSPSVLKDEFPHLDFNHLDDPWWHHEVASAEPFVIEPRWMFERRVSEFKGWLRDHAAERIAVVGHGTFFQALSGHWMRNCEVLVLKGEAGGSHPAWGPVQAAAPLA